MLRISKQQGIGLPAAIFVITLMAGIAVAINQLVSQNAQTFEEQINLARAFYAAESGAGFAMNTVFPPEAYPSYASGAECVETPRVYNFTVDGVNQCSASVTCGPPIVIGGSNFATIESEGTCGDVTKKIQVRTVF